MKTPKTNEEMDEEDNLVPARPPVQKRVGRGGDKGGDGFQKGVSSVKDEDEA